MEREQALDRVKEEITTYLRLNGYEPNQMGKYTCPNPSHNDTNPSANVIPSNPVLLRCHGCGWVGDIFHLASIFEKLPMHGPDFEQQTLPSLCKTLNIPYEPPALTESDMIRHKAMRAYKDAVYTMTGFGVDDPRLTSRGWTAQTCSRTLTGVVPSWEEFLSRMKERGYTASYLKEIDINSRIFNEHTIVFTWCDVYGQPRGFTARDLRYDSSGARNLSKFINTSSKCPIYNKGEMLYGMDWAKRCSPIIITEGMPDVNTAFEHGFHNVVCVGGTSFSKKHVKLLQKLQIDDIVFVMNDDKAGVDATNKALDIFAEMSNHGIRVRVLDIGYFLFADGERIFKPDIDNAFKNSPDTAKLMFTDTDKYAESALGWRMRHYPEDMSDEEKVDKTLDFIVSSESNNIRREKAIKQLASMVDMEDRSVAIYREYEKKVYAESHKVQEEGERLRSELQRISRTKNVGAFLEDLESLGCAATDIRQKFSASDHNKHETMEFLDELKSHIEKTEGQLLGFDSGFQQLNEAFLGIPWSGRMIGLCGEPSSGKSSFMHQLIHNLIRKNEDILVLLLTIDDNRTAVMPRLISIDSGLTTQQVKQPSTLSPEQKSLLDTSWTSLKNYVRGNRLDIRDSGHGNTLDYFESWIRYAKQQNPNRKILAMLDNFHKLAGVGSDERQIYKRASARIQELKTEYDITFICTMELIKTYGKEGRPDDIAETKKILYDADAVIHINSDWQRTLTDSGLTWTDPTGNQKPIIRIRTWKNKIHGLLPTIWYDMDPDNSRFVERDTPPEERITSSRVNELMRYGPSPGVMSAGNR